MRVLFDLRGAQEQRHPERGIPRYVAGHAEALRKHAAVSQVYGLIDPERPVPRVGEILAARGELISPRDVGRLVDDGRGLVHHVSAPFEFDFRRDQLLPSALHRPDVVRAVTLYDVIPLVFAGTSPSVWQLRMWSFRAAMVRSADLVLCISQFTARDGIQRLGLDPGRVRVIGAGVPAVDPAALESIDTLPDLPGLVSPFVLSVGGGEPRKNVEALVRAFARLEPGLRAAHQLVVTSRADSSQREQLLEVARRADVGDRVLIPGYVSDGLLRRLFATCRCFVYPSLYEGLGLPVIEAMSYGAATITSDTTGCGEVAAHPDATFDATDEADISAAMARVLSDRQLRRTLRDYGRQRAAEYTWDRVADKTVGAYADAARTKPRRMPRRPGRDSVVFASYSLPAAASSAGSLLLMAAAASRDVRVSFASPAPLRPRQVGFRVLDSARLQPALRWLEGALVCLADSPQAAERSAELLAERSGIVIVWDFDRLVPGLDPDGAGADVDRLRDLASVAQRLVVASAADAARVQRAVGRRACPEPVVLPPALGWVAEGRLGHQLPFEAAILSNPERQAVRSRRAVRLLVAPRRPTFGPFEPEEIERAGDLAIALSRRGFQARVLLLGEAAPGPVARAQRRCGAVGGRLAHADWPIFGEFVAWTTAADVFVDLGGASIAASRATTDQALLAGRPALLVGHSATETPGVCWLPATATPAKLAEATTALLAAGPADRTEVLRQRTPGSSAERLLATLGIGDLGGWSGPATLPEPSRRLLRAPRAAEPDRPSRLSGAAGTSG